MFDAAQRRVASTWEPGCACRLESLLWKTPVWESTSDGWRQLLQQCKGDNQAEGGMWSCSCSKLRRLWLH